MLHRDAIFTNVAVTADKRPWWEGLDDGVPAVDWQGRPYAPGNGPAAHPNSRFTVSARQCPSWSPKMDDPRGVPISAIVFGGRRESLVPLVFEARDWNHGVLVGASMASETTAAATGAVGVVRRDSMAMKPFCGYNFGDYFAHWLAVGGQARNAPRIFHVNWFRKGANGRFLWPGFGDNMRVLEWMLERCAGRADALDTPIGFVPRSDDLDLEGLALDGETVETLLDVEPSAWVDEYAAIGSYLDEYAGHVPQALRYEHARVVAALHAAARPLPVHGEVRAAAAQ
jgi:phosphoenolpyruvate carboxykinase (GTP)